MSSPVDDHSRSAAPELVANVKRAVDARLGHHLDRAKARAAALSPLASRSPNDLADALDSLVKRGGKRLRPALVVAGFAAVSESFEVRAIPLAVIDAGCAWEILQAYFLIHDDWMDGDETRRGGPSVHVMLGDHGAILAGDLGCALAHRVLLEADAEASIVRDAAVVFARVHEEVVLGQALDMSGMGLDRAEIERMYALKTASYTTCGPIEIGAIFGLGDRDARASLDRWARAIGVAFQLADDLIGTFGDPRETGKPIGSDLRAGKRTALVAEALTRVGSLVGTSLDKLAARKGLEPEEVPRAIEAIAASGARRAIEARIEELRLEAGHAIESAKITRRGRQLLSALGARLTERSA